jgi:hypothetical protein
MVPGADGNKVAGRRSRTVMLVPVQSRIEETASRMHGSAASK